MLPVFFNTLQLLVNQLVRLLFMFRAGVIFARKLAAKAKINLLHSWLPLACTTLKACTSTLTLSVVQTQTHTRKHTRCIQAPSSTWLCYPFGLAPSVFRNEGGKAGGVEGESGWRGNGSGWRRGGLSRECTEREKRGMDGGLVWM